MQVPPQQLQWFVEGSVKGQLPGVQANLADHRWGSLLMLIYFFSDSY